MRGRPRRCRVSWRPVCVCVSVLATACMHMPGAVGASTLAVALLCSHSLPLLPPYAQAPLRPASSRGTPRKSRSRLPSLGDQSPRFANDGGWPGSRCATPTRPGSAAALPRFTRAAPSKGRAGANPPSAAWQQQRAGVALPQVPGGGRGSRSSTPRGRSSAVSAALPLPRT